MMSLWQKIKLNSLTGTQPVLNLWPSHILYSRKIRGRSVSQTHTALCFCAFVHSVHFVWTAHPPKSNIWNRIPHLGPLSCSSFRRDSLISSSGGQTLFAPERLQGLLGGLSSVLMLSVSRGNILKGSICAVPLCLIAVSETELKEWMSIVIFPLFGILFLGF